jgi:plasmid replication initiation protein
MTVAVKQIAHQGLLVEGESIIGDAIPRREFQVVESGGAKESTSVVTKSNYLIEAKYRLGHCEQKFILYLISNINPDQTYINRYRLSVADLSRIVNSNLSFAQAEEFMVSLKKRNIDIFDPVSNRRILMSWLSTVVFDRKNGQIDVAFDNTVKPFLLGLRECFTSYPVKFALRLRRGSSIRMYELLATLRNLPRKSRSYKYSDLRETLGIGESEYAKFTDFKRWVLEPAREELNKTTDLAFTYAEERVKRKVVKVKFDVEFRDKLPDETSEEVIWKSELAEKLMGEPFGISAAAVEKYVDADRPRDFWKWAIATIVVQIKRKPPKNPAGYAVRELKNCWKQWGAIEMGRQLKEAKAIETKTPLQKNAKAEALPLQVFSDAKATVAWEPVKAEILKNELDEASAERISALVAVQLRGSEILLVAEHAIASFMIGQMMPYLNEISAKQGWSLTLTDGIGQI